MTSGERRGRLPRAGEGKRGRDGYTAYLVRQANAAIRRALDRALDDLAITSPQFSVLIVIGAYEPLSSAELARLALLTPQTINDIVRQLEQRGAIKRSPHAVHGRILNVTLTAEGRRLLGRCRARADTVNRHLDAGFETEAERAAVRRWLSHVATALAGNGTPRGEKRRTERSK